MEEDDDGNPCPSYGAFLCSARLEIELNLHWDRLKAAKSTIKYDHCERSLLEHFEGIKPCFNFAGLMPELQLHIIEMLSYDDLKILQRTSLLTRRLVATRTPVLDASLFRAAIDTRRFPCTPKQHSKAQISLHPIILQAKRLRDEYSEPILVMKAGPEEAICWIERLDEFKSENATDPPTSEIRLCLSPDYGPSYPAHWERHVYVIRGSRDAKGNELPITIAQYYNGHVQALALEGWQDPEAPYARPGHAHPGLAWFFALMKTKWIDERGCLYLEDAEWRPSEVE